MPTYYTCSNSLPSEITIALTLPPQNLKGGSRRARIKFKLQINLLKTRRTMLMAIAANRRSQGTVTHLLPIIKISTIRTNICVNT